MFCEESPAGNPGEVIRRRELAILDERYAQHGFELGNPPGSADARPQLTLRRPAPDAVIRSRNQTRFALMTFVELRNVQDVRRTVCLARAYLANQLQVVRDDHGVELRPKQAHCLELIGNGLAIEDICADRAFDVIEQRCILEDEQGSRRRQDAQHYGDRRRSILLDRRRFLGAFLEYALNDGGLSARAYQWSPASGLSNVQRRVLGLRAEWAAALHGGKLFGCRH